VKNGKVLITPCPIPKTQNVRCKYEVGYNQPKDRESINTGIHINEGGLIC